MGLVERERTELDWVIVLPLEGSSKSASSPDNERARIFLDLGVGGLIPLEARGRDLTGEMLTDVTATTWEEPCLSSLPIVSGMEPERREGDSGETEVLPLRLWSRLEIWVGEEGPERVDMIGETEKVGG